MSKSNAGIPQGKIHFSDEIHFLPIAIPLNIQVKLPEDLIKCCLFAYNKNSAIRFLESLKKMCGLEMVNYENMCASAHIQQLIIRTV